MATHTLSRKQKKFINYWLKHPKASGTEAALVAYNTSNRVVAASIAYENLKKPQIQAYLNSFTAIAEETILAVVRDWGESDDPRQRAIAVEAAKYLHDKVAGKAQRITSAPHKGIVMMSINLTGDNERYPT